MKKALLGILVVALIAVCFLVPAVRDAIAQTAQELRYGFTVTYGSGRIGTGSTPDITLGDDDLFVEGTIEADGELQADGAIDANSTLDVAGATTLASTLAVTGTSTLTGAQTLTGATTCSSTLGVTGAITATANINANGNIVGDGATQLTGAIAATQDFTANDTLTIAEAGKVCTNAGAEGAVTLTLPEASTCKGLAYAFYVYTAQTFGVNPSDTQDQIIGLTNAAGDSITSSTVADSVKLTAIGDDTWGVDSIYPTNTDWADAN